MEIFSVIIDALLLTALRDGSTSGNIPVLLVHVVRPTTGIVSQPDAKVLHLGWLLLIDLQRKKDIDSAKLYKKHKSY